MPAHRLCSMASACWGDDADSPARRRLRDALIEAGASPAATEEVAAHLSRRAYEPSLLKAVAVFAGLIERPYVSLLARDMSVCLASAQGPAA